MWIKISSSYLHLTLSSNGSILEIIINQCIQQIYTTAILQHLTITMLLMTRKNTFYIFSSFLSPEDSFSQDFSTCCESQWCALGNLQICINT